jgi:aldose 1-epimerase
LSGSELEIETFVELLGDEVAETYVNITSHPYFNLTGFKEQNVKNHLVLMQDVPATLEMMDDQIPTSALNTPSSNPELFFLQEDSFGSRLPEVQRFRGFDHYYLLKTRNDFITITSSAGVGLRVSTTNDGFQMYTGNWVSVDKCKKSHGCLSYGNYSGFCVEPSQPPNSINLPEYRDSVIVTKSKPWNHIITYELFLTN